MAERQDGQIVETATEARQAEPGPSIFMVLGGIWFMFFKT